MLVVLRHWGVETAHQILDIASVEHVRPWIEANPRGALVVAILRRLAYTMLTLFRSVTLRSDERRDVPWKTLLGEIFLAFMTLTNEKLGPRSRLSFTPDCPPRTPPGADAPTFTNRPVS